MTTGTQLSASASPSEHQPQGPTRPAGAFERLRAFDGLFLRAEHLNVMQDYTRDLTSALGRSGGGGVVEGYGLELQDNTLVAGPGLAVTPNGQPLLANTPLRLELDSLEPDSSTYFRILLRPGKWDHGSEPVQGLLCNEPCSGGTTQKIKTAEGPWLALEAVAEPLLASQTMGHRSWLASHLFHREETDAPRWPDSKTSDLPRDWSPSPSAQPAATVCLGVLLKDPQTGQWVLDVWAGRRDLGEPPPAHHWQWSLGVRPWAVFIAQVLQFQAQLADILRQQEFQPSMAEYEEVQRRLQEVQNALSANPPQAQAEALVSKAAELMASLKMFSLKKPPRSSSTGGLKDLGFVELPPAGFLPSFAKELDDIRSEIGDLVGRNGLIRRVCTIALGDVGEVLAAAQSRERTNIAPSWTEGQRGGVLDLYVPVAAGERATSWILFTRSRMVDCTEAGTEPVPDEVQVYSRVHDHDKDDIGEGKEAADPDKGNDLGILKYPPGTWAVPEVGSSLFRQVQKAVSGNRVTAVEAVVRSEERRPLGYLRATLLATGFTSDATLQAVTTAVTTTVNPAQPESITVDTTPGLSKRTGAESASVSELISPAEATHEAATVTKPTRRTAPRRRPSADNADEGSAKP
jgi:hypothetical protein